MSNRVKIFGIICILFIAGILYFWSKKTEKRFDIYFDDEIITIQSYSVKENFLEVIDLSGKKEKIPIIDVDFIKEVEEKE